MEKQLSIPAVFKMMKKKTNKLVQTTYNNRYKIAYKVGTTMR